MNYYDSNWLVHHGIKGQKWGVRRYQNEDGTLTDLGKKHYQRDAKKKLNNFYRNMSINMKYDDSIHTLKNPALTEKDNSGNCHDQVLYEITNLKSIGYEPKAMFLIEASEGGQGGTTHSYVYFKDDDHYVWFENAWEKQKGLHRYVSEQELHNDVIRKFKKEQTMSNTYYGKFDTNVIKPGYSLQDIVDNIELEKV